MTPPFLPGTEVLFMRDVVFGVVVPWISMLPFVLVVIATIEMIMSWLPSRLPDDPPTEPIPVVITTSGPNGTVYLCTDPELLRMSQQVVDPTRFISGPSGA